MSALQENKEHETHPLFQSRWSPRAFDANKDVAKHDVQSCLEAARWSPSCFGDEPWRFMVFERASNEEAWQQMLSCLAPKNQEWAQFAPVLVAVCAHNVFQHNGKPNRWAEYDTGAAAVSFCLQASALGLATHQMGGFDGDAVCDKFSVPKDFKVMSILALGYQGDADQLDGNFKEAELMQRKRKSLADIAFDGAWLHG